MDNLWYKIWCGKDTSDVKVDKDEFNSYCALKKADGFDVAVDNEERYFLNFYQGFLNSFEKMKELTGKDSFNSLFEVGCGSGVNLYLLKSRLNEGSYIGGLDYSERMIELAKRIVEGVDLYYGNATELPIEPKTDLVIADSVFQYFDSHEYAKQTLVRMLDKANDLVFLGEIHNEDLHDEWLDNRRKTIANYDERYKGLNKLFFSKSWLEDIAKQKGRRIYFEDIHNEEYLNSKYIFNVYFY